jgi:hypothetical protein
MRLRAGRSEPAKKADVIMYQQAFSRETAQTLTIPAIHA